MSGREAVVRLLDTIDVPRGTLERLDIFAAQLLDESERQNLIAASTVPDLWSRHILDSLQLIMLAPDRGTWLDIGSGAGLPGLVIAAAGRHAVTLAEPRRRRVEFLEAAASAMGVDVRVHHGRAETLPLQRFHIISARAVASLEQLLVMASRLSDDATRLIFPKGRGAAIELAAARGSWQGEFSVVPSLTDDEASIVTARHVKAKGRQ